MSASTMALDAVDPNTTHKSSTEFQQAIGSHFLIPVSKHGEKT